MIILMIASLQILRELQLAATLLESIYFSLLSNVSSIEIISLSIVIHVHINSIVVAVLLFLVVG